MRKLNTILSVLLLFICLLHGLMGSFMLLGISSGAGKFLAWISVGVCRCTTYERCTFFDLFSRCY